MGVLSSGSEEEAGAGIGSRTGAAGGVLITSDGASCTGVGADMASRRDGAVDNVDGTRVNIAEPEETNKFKSPSPTSLAPPLLAVPAAADDDVVWLSEGS